MRRRPGIDPGRLLAFPEIPSGLRALIAIHDTTLGPAAGGVRTRVYADEWSALRDAAALAHTMTLKCALAGLPCGGGKAVVMEHPGLDRERAFEILGAAVEALGGLFHTAGDLGTHEADLRAMERRTQYVSLDAQGLDLEGATARGVVLALREGAFAIGATELSQLEVIVQGVGAVGSVVAQMLAERGARVALTDTDSRRAQQIAEAIGARVIDPADAASTQCDVFVPCAMGGLIDVAIAGSIPCRMVCGAANNPLADDASLAILESRGVLYIPDFVANAGAVIEGIGSSILGLDDRSGLIERIAETTRTVIQLSRERGVSTLTVARSLAQERIQEAMPNWRRSG